MPDVAEVGRCRKLDITNAEFPKDRSYHRCESKNVAPPESVKLTLTRPALGYIILLCHIRKIPTYIVAGLST
ncbi:hypothetical protein J6590_081472 [Homalodisca vitripennis]|nr:hypothetical protein J6590_081472 [Homalodisca vitripennis]